MNRHTLLLLISISILVIVVSVLTNFNKYVVVCDSLELQVIDGDTFRWHNKKVRIYGIDTLELTKQKKWVLHYIDKKNYSCLKYYSYRAKEVLENIFNNYCIKIEFLGHDKYGRILARVYNCTGNICTDIGEYLVLNGLAISFGDTYKYAERFARRRNLGFWSCN